MEALLQRLEKSRITITNNWAYQVSQISPSYKKISLKELERSADKAFTTFLEIIRRNDFGPVDNYIEWLTKTRTSQGISFTELQQAFTVLRYIMFEIICQNRADSQFQELISHISQAIDWIVFRFSLYFRELHEQKLKDYAEELEDQVRKRSRELEESRRNYQELFEEISDGCFVWQNDRIILANKGFCEMHARTQEEVLGRPYLPLVADDFVDLVGRRFSEVLAGDPPSDCFIFFRKDQSGQRLLAPTEVKSKQIIFGGQPAVLVLCSDITQRLEMEEKLRQQDRFAILGSLTASIAHEIRNPLSAIKVNTQILLDRLSPSKNDRRRLEISYEQLSHLEKIISQMLDYSKPIRFNYTISDLHQTVDYALELIRAKFDKHQIKVSKRFNPTLPPVMVDRERVVAALINIFNNSVDALYDSQGPRRITLQSSRDRSAGRDYIRLTITDNGPGIAEEDCQAIFEPFFTKGKADGIGLGLAIVKKIIQGHRGKIWAEHRPGQGACFVLLMPINVL